MAEFCMISCLAIIAFAAKKHTYLIVPEKSSYGFVLWDAPDDRPRGLAYLIKFVNTQLPETLPQYSALV
jgi:hypothetical protein